LRGLSTLFFAGLDLAEEEPMEEERIWLLGEGDATP
jgi:hypothetical protein